MWLEQQVKDGVEPHVCGKQPQCVTLSVSMRSRRAACTASMSSTVTSVDNAAAAALALLLAASGFTAAEDDEEDEDDEEEDEEDEAAAAPTSTSMTFLCTRSRPLRSSNTSRSASLICVSPALSNTALAPKRMSDASSPLLMVVPPMPKAQPTSSSASLPSTSSVSSCASATMAFRNSFFSARLTMRSSTDPLHTRRNTRTGLVWPKEQRRARARAWEMSELRESERWEGLDVGVKGTWPMRCARSIACKST